ncbi:hypothetical protein CLV62_1254 [Dysgonomonas alginatilytica]|uniref:Uncharacterized protein n=1 Tax=Dysgonomonas alginatilytica TaxID=1605892 RepID=A0A2V3PKW2_9BACT|nr:hypothetical protein [Dysgonomonas alginatilytica]PXV61171.1 hypothetical protein CLV62_1254 [Dysgonomonas alginatilytica]
MIENIITKINANIGNRSGELCDVEVPILYGLALSILVRSLDEDEDEDQIAYPAIVDNEGECKYVFADDDYSFGVYHRILNRSYSQTKKGYGDTNYDIATDEMILICWGFRDLLKMDSLTFESQIIVPSLPKEALLVQSNFDQFSVFNNEFKNVVYNLIPELFLFSIKYKVQYTFNRECVEISEQNKC